MGRPINVTPEKLMARRQRVSELYLECNSMAEIGRIIGVTANTVYHDICWAREQWRTRSADAIAKHKQRELSRIDHLEIEAWRGWRRSVGRVVTTKDESGTGAQGLIDKTSKTTEYKAGDPRFLDIVAKCIQSRRDMLGLDAPKSLKVQDERTPEMMSDSELNQLILRKAADLQAIVISVKGNGNGNGHGPN